MRSIESFLPRVVFIGIGLVGAGLLASLALYGTSVIFETHVLELGRKTRTITEDNQSLQVQLDRLRSYQNVAESSHNVQGLKTPSLVLDIAEKPATQTEPLPKKVALPPREAYGY